MRDDRRARLLAYLLVAILFVIQIQAVPTVWNCMARDGNYWKPLGKMHCELEGWRFLYRLISTH